jgi:hypothetical protein
VVTHISEEPAASICRIKDRCGRFNCNITTIYLITWHSILKVKYLNSTFQDLSPPDPAINIITYSLLAIINNLGIIFKELKTTAVIEELQHRY